MIVTVLTANFLFGNGGLTSFFFCVLLRGGSRDVQDRLRCLILYRIMDETSRLLPTFGKNLFGGEEKG